MSKASAMAAAVQVEVAEDNAVTAVCEPTPVVMEAFGFIDDVATTEVEIVAVEVVIVDVVDDSSNMFHRCVRKLQRIQTVLVSEGVCCDLVADISIKHHEIATDY